MSKITRETPPGDGGSVEHRLARLLEAPFLERIVPHLAPETLHQLVQHRGLHACGALITAVTPTQLNALLDLDLWRKTAAGRDEQFDVDRFGDWLEALIDAGDSVAARTVAALDRDIVVAGLCRHVRVLDPGIFEPTAQSDDEAIDRHDSMNSETSRDLPDCEIGGYLIRARRTDAWDAIVALCVALEIEHHDDFHALMQACRRLSNSRPELDGFHDLPLAPDQHLSELASERERRRSRQGYATVADARAFLHMARQRQQDQGAMNPIAAAYFRAAEEDADVAPGQHAAEETAATAGDAASIETAIALLAEAGVLRQGYGGHGLVPGRPRLLLNAAQEDARAGRMSTLQRGMEFALHHDQSAYLARSRELAFLANTLLAGCSVQSRPFTPPEASDAAASICNLGLECWPEPIPDSFLIAHDLVNAFEAGWSLLYREVTLFVTDQLLSLLPTLPNIDADTRLELLRSQRTLAKHRDAGTPWLARNAVEAIATLDMTAWISVLGLLDECPILPAALNAILDGSTAPVDPGKFDFISTTAQLGDVRIFMRALPAVLSR